MENSEDCSKIITKAVGCIMNKILDNLHIALIIFIILFLIIGVQQAGLFSNVVGINRGSGTRNQIEMFNGNKSKRGKITKKR